MKYAWGLTDTQVYFTWEFTGFICLDGFGLSDLRLN